MKAFRDVSIKRKLIILTTLISMVVVVLATAAFLVRDLITFKQSLADDLKGLAGVIGANTSAALAFKDRKAAEETLAALGVRSHVVSAAVFSKDGTALARFVRHGGGKEAVGSFPDDFQARFSDDYLFVSQPVLLDGEMIGRVAIQYDLAEIGERMRSYRDIALTVLLLAMFAALSLAAVLQRTISDPLMGLAATARTITREKKYGLRAPKQGQDEIGEVIESFNEMLDQIQKRDAMLEEHRDFLESEVAARTQALKQANEALIAEVGRRAAIERALASEKERLSVTLRSIADCVIATDLEGRIILMNRATEELAGRTQDDIVGRPLDAVFKLSEASAAGTSVDPVAEVLKTGAALERIDHAVLSRNGSERLFAHTSSPIRDRRGEIIGVIIAFRDITDKHRMEEELLRSRRLESLGVLAGGIAHDFNNLLTAILGNISLSMTLVTDERASDRLSRAEKASLRARDLTQQLLTFAKGGKPVKRTTLISDLLVDACGFALSGAKTKCAFDMPEDLWPVDVDEGQISQVINNLIINADQAMERGGVITIQARNTILGVNTRLPVAPGRYVVITFSDHGHGISEEQLSRIFDPYFTTKAKGSGLGLTTSYSIVKRHDGIITVDSKPGKGATFTVYLPASDKPLPADHRRVSEEARRGKGRILVMDDEDIVLEVAGTMLTHLGYKVDFASEGREAVDRYRRSLSEGHPYDAVIIDLTIPGGMGGREAMEQLLALDPNVKGIVSSGYSQGPIMAEYRSYGFRGVVAKPYRIDDLGRVVMEVIFGGQRDK